jgi:RimJ/RimL family protein N-acetyltransferase
VDALMGIFSDPEAMRYYPSTKSRVEAEYWLRWVRQSYEENGFGLWAAILKETGEFTGQCGLMPQEVEDRREVEIGYLFLRRFWKRGLATEAASASRDYGFIVLGRDRLVSLIDAANVPSKRVAERIGMRFEKKVTWHGKRICLYSITS